MGRGRRGRRVDLPQLRHCRLQVRNVEDGRERSSGDDEGWKRLRGPNVSFSSSRVACWLGVGCEAGVWRYAAACPAMWVVAQSPGETLALVPKSLLADHLHLEQCLYRLSLVA